MKLKHHLIATLVLFAFGTSLTWAQNKESAILYHSEIDLPTKHQYGWHSVVIQNEEEYQEQFKEAKKLPEIDFEQYNLIGASYCSWCVRGCDAYPLKDELRKREGEGENQQTLYFLGYDEHRNQCHRNACSYSLKWYLVKKKEDQGMYYNTEGWERLDMGSFTILAPTYWNQLSTLEQTKQAKVVNGTQDTILFDRHYRHALAEVIMHQRQQYSYYAYYNCDYAYPSPPLGDNKEHQEWYDKEVKEIEEKIADCKSKNEVLRQKNEATEAREMAEEKEHNDRKLQTALKKEWKEDIKHHFKQRDDLKVELQLVTGEEQTLSAVFSIKKKLPPPAEGTIRFNKSELLWVGDVTVKNLDNRSMREFLEAMKTIELK